MARRFVFPVILAALVCTTAVWGSGRSPDAPRRPAAVERSDRPFAGDVRPGPGGEGEASPAGGPGSLECQVDVACPLGDALVDQRRGVVRLVTPYVDEFGQSRTRFCSGALINTTAFDCTRPYVLTADHCFAEVPTANPQQTQFYFNDELPACGGGQSDPRLTVGATVRARSADSDFLLLELNSAPLPEWRPYYLGWSRSGAAPGAAWLIHHPSNDVKKINHDTGPVTTSAVEADHWRVAGFEVGRVEGGSSGAPLLDADGRIVGQLHRSTESSCAAPDGPSEYGKLAAAWGQGLAALLDPLGTGATGIDGLDQAACDAGTRPVFDSALVTDDLGNEDGTLDPGEIATIRVSLANAGIDAATALSATLASDDPRVTIREALAAWPALPGLAGGTPSVAPHFRVEVDPAVDCGENIPFSLTIDGAEGSWNDGFLLASGTTVDGSTAFADDFESGAPGWDEMSLSLPGVNPWFLTEANSVSGTTSWFVGGNLNGRDSVLLAPPQGDLPPGARLSFWHDLVSDNGFDGGVLELSVDGGEWTDAEPYFVEGGYNGGISVGFSSSIAGRRAWTGDTGGWQQVAVDLSSFEGTQLELRWRFVTDQFTGSRGWYVDDVTIERDVRECPPRYVNLLPGALCTGASSREGARSTECSVQRPGLPSRPENRALVWLPRPSVKAPW